MHSNRDGVFFISWYQKHSKRWDRFIIFSISAISTWNKMMFHILVFFILIDFFTWDLPKGMRKSHLESAFWFRLGFSFSHILFCWTWQNISNWSLFEHIFTCAFDLQPVICSENIRLFDKYMCARRKWSQIVATYFQCKNKVLPKFL